MSFINDKLNVSIGDKIVVSGIMPPAQVAEIWFDPKTARTIIELDWGDRGKSKVYDHDQNKVWYKYSESN